jgi:hypothetical protein
VSSARPWIAPALAFASAAAATAHEVVWARSIGRVVGNTAWIAGTVRNARGAIPRDGTVSYFYVTDNGEGADAPPDRASAIRINDLPGQDIAFCTDRPVVLPASDIAHGNVQVR